MQVGATRRLAIRIGKHRGRNYIAAVRFIDLGKVDLVGGAVRLELETCDLAGTHPQGNISKQQGVILHAGNRARLLGARLSVTVNSRRHTRMLREGDNDVLLGTRVKLGIVDIQKRDSFVRRKRGRLGKLPTVRTTSRLQTPSKQQ